MNHKFWNEVSESWTIGENENVVAKELGITVEEVRKVYDFIDESLEKCFEQQKDIPMPPEDEKYFELVNK